MIVRLIEFQKARRGSVPFAGGHSPAFRRRGRQVGRGCDGDSGAGRRNADDRTAARALARPAGLIVGARYPVAVRTDEADGHHRYGSPPRRGEQSGTARLRLDVGMLHGGDTVTRSASEAKFSALPRLRFGFVSRVAGCDEPGHRQGSAPATDAYRAGPLRGCLKQSRLTPAGAPQTLGLEEKSTSGSQSSDAHADSGQLPEM